MQEVGHLKKKLLPPHSGQLRGQRSIEFVEGTGQIRPSYVVATADLIADLKTIR